MIVMTEMINKNEWTEMIEMPEMANMIEMTEMMNTNEWTEMTDMTVMANMTKMSNVELREIFRTYFFFIYNFDD